MRKAIYILMILIILFMTGCTSISTNQSTVVDETTVPTNTTNVTIETDEAIINIEVNMNNITETNDVLTVIVTITAKEIINRELGTSTHGEEGIIGIRVISVDDSNSFLYSSVYDILINGEILSVSLESGESLMRTLQFARLPFNGGFGGEEISPIGEYKVQVSLYSQELGWVDTGLMITVL